jgi:hypothetical protein
MNDWSRLAVDPTRCKNSRLKRTARIQYAPDHARTARARASSGSMANKASLQGERVGQLRLSLTNTYHEWPVYFIKSDICTAEARNGLPGRPPQKAPIVRKAELGAGCSKNGTVTADFPEGIRVPPGRNGSFRVAHPAQDLKLAASSMEIARSHVCETLPRTSPSLRHARRLPTVPAHLRRRTWRKRLCFINSRSVPRGSPQQYILNHFESFANRSYLLLLLVASFPLSMKRRDRYTRSPVIQGVLEGQLEPFV